MAPFPCPSNQAAKKKRPPALSSSEEEGDDSESSNVSPPASPDHKKVKFTEQRALTIGRDPFGLAEPGPTEKPPCQHHHVAQQLMISCTGVYLKTTRPNAGSAPLRPRS